MQDFESSTLVVRQACRLRQNLAQGDGPKTYQFPAPRQESEMGPGATIQIWSQHVRNALYFLMFAEGTVDIKKVEGETP